MLTETNIFSVKIFLKRTLKVLDATTYLWLFLYCCVLVLPWQPTYANQMFFCHCAVTLKATLNKCVYDAHSGQRVAHKIFLSATSPVWMALWHNRRQSRLLGSFSPMKRRFLLSGRVNSKN